MSEIGGAAVVGTGTMGPGMGAVLERAGIEVALYDVSEEALDRARDGVELARGVLERLGTEQSTGGDIRFETDLAASLEGADFVLEAVPEKLELKQEVFAEFERHVADDAVLSSNTSGIPITKIAENLEHPERVIGMHWSNPPHLIPMIEVIPGERTSDATIAAAQGADRASRLPRQSAQEGGPRVRREPRALRDHARVPRARRRGRDRRRGARPERQVGNRLQARRDPADAAARRRRARHLRERRQLPELRPLDRVRCLGDDHQADRAGQARASRRAAGCSNTQRTSSPSCRPSAPRRWSRSARHSTRRTSEEVRRWV